MNIIYLLILLYMLPHHQRNEQGNWKQKRKKRREGNAFHFICTYLCNRFIPKSHTYIK